MGILQWYNTKYKVLGLRRPNLKFHVNWELGDNEWGTNSTECNGLQLEELDTKQGERLG